MGKIITVGIDLAKNVFSLHAIDEKGAVVLRRTLPGRSCRRRSRSGPPA